MARVGGALAGVLGLLGLVGWGASVPWLTSLAPNRAPMVPLTAIALVLASCGLLLRGRTAAGWRRAVVILCGALVGAIGGFFCVEHALGLPTGVEGLLAERPVMSSHPGRPSPVVAAALAFAGVAIVGLGIKVRRSCAVSWAGSLVALIGLFALTGHALGARALYFFGGSTLVGVALPAAAALLLLGAAIVLTQAQCALARYLSAKGTPGMLVRRLVPAMVAVPPIVGMGLRLMEREGLDEPSLILTLYAVLLIPIGVAGVLATARSIARVEHELRVARKALQTAHESEQRALRREVRARSWLQDLVDQMPEGVIVTDGERRVVLINRAARAYNPPEALFTDPRGNRLSFDVLSPSGEPLAWENLPLVRAVLRGERVTSVELKIRRSDGVLVPMLASATPIAGEAEGQVGAVVVFQDVTLLKEIERMREEWTSVVAHDLRQPVSVISLAADYLARTAALSPSAQTTLERIRKAARTLGRMTSDLLDASRIEARRLKLERRCLRLGPWVLDLVERAGPELGGGRIRVHAAEALPDVDADPQRLEQIMVNLLSNAVKYGDAESDIEITAEARAHDVVVSVANRGAGLEPGELQQVFTRYFRASRAHGEGAGLGLYIVKGLVEAHGGRVSVESEPGQTTVFRFTLPRVVEPTG